MLRWTANKPCLGSGERMSPVSRAVCYTDTVKGLSQRQLLYWLAECSSHPRDWTRVSCIADRFSTVWANREARSNHDGRIQIWWEAFAVRVYHILFSVQMLAKICLLLATIHWKDILSLHTNFLIAVLFKSLRSFHSYLYIKSMCIYSPTCAFILFWVSRWFSGFRSLNIVGENHWPAPEGYSVTSCNILGPSFPLYFPSFSSQPVPDMTEAFLTLSLVVCCHTYPALSMPIGFIKAASSSS